MKIGLFGLLGVIFIVLKLTGVIAWSWWLVTMPLWAGTVLYLVFICVVFILKMYIINKTNKS